VDDTQPTLPGIDETGGDGKGQGAAAAVSARKELPPHREEGSEDELLNEIFRERGGRLRLEEPQLRATGKLDYAQRLTYIYLYFREKAGDESVPRSDVTTILEDSTVNDGNWRTWIGKESSLVKDGDRIHLNSAGRRLARKYLAEVFDDEAKGKWLPGETSRASKSSGTGSNGTEKAGKVNRGKAGRKSLITTQWVPKWKTLGLVSNGYSLFNGLTVAQKGLFGLWAIQKAAGDDGRVASLNAIQKFLFEAFEIKVNCRSLERALKHQADDKKVHYMGGTKFQITPDGKAEVEDIISAGKTTSSASVTKTKEAAKK
jgi:hypothetical protein